jgi:hypothetical protein
LGFEVVGHLPEIADVFGYKCGLMISLLRVAMPSPGGAPGGAPPENT